jgi:hypothetical protein
MRPNEVHSIHDFITYSQAILAEHPEDMDKEQQRSPAGALTVLMANEEYHGEWQKYPQIIDILDTASDLDILNVDSAQASWMHIRHLVDELQLGAG